jgi:hypothetical protein
MANGRAVDRYRRKRTRIKKDNPIHAVMRKDLELYLVGSSSIQAVFTEEIQFKNI